MVRDKIARNAKIAKDRRYLNAKNFSRELTRMDANQEKLLPRICADERGSKAKALPQRPLRNAKEFSRELTRMDANQKKLLPRISRMSADQARLPKLPESGDCQNLKPKNFHHNKDAKEHTGNQESTKLPIL